MFYLFGVSKKGWRKECILAYPMNIIQDIETHNYVIHLVDETLEYIDNPMSRWLLYVFPCVLFQTPSPSVICLRVT